MEAVFIRHGESEANLAGVIQGRSDHRLSERGREQALRTAAALADFEPYRIYTSPLLRARETAEIINRRHNAALVVLPDLIEYNLGEFEGQTWNEIVAGRPGLVEDLKRGVPFHHLASGAETDEAADVRGQRVLDEIVNSGLPRVIVVAHLGILDRIIRRALAEYIPGQTEFSGPLNNCSITTLLIHPFTSKVIKLNDISHLK